MAIKSKILGDRVILESVLEKTQSSGSLLILPEEKNAKLIVVAIGTSDKIPKQIKVGKRVWATTRSVKPVQIDGKDYFSVASSDILAIEEK